MIKIPFSHEEHLQTFPFSLPCKSWALPFTFALASNPKNIFYYQHDVENYTDQVLDILLFDRDKYLQTESSSL